MLLFWISKFIHFVQILFKLSVSRRLNFSAVYWSKSWFTRISNWKYCSAAFCNGHVTDIKIIMFWTIRSMYFVQILFKPSVSQSFDFKEFIGIKVYIKSSISWIRAFAVHTFKTVTWLKSKCSYFVIYVWIGKFIYFVQNWFKLLVSTWNYNTNRNNT